MLMCYFLHEVVSSTSISFAAAVKSHKSNEPSQLFLSLYLPHKYVSLHISRYRSFYFPASLCIKAVGEYIVHSVPLWPQRYELWESDDGGTASLSHVFIMHSMKHLIFFHATENNLLSISSASVHTHGFGDEWKMFSLFYSIKKLKSLQLNAEWTQTKTSLDEKTMNPKLILYLIHKVLTDFDSLIDYL